MTTFVKLPRGAGVVHVNPAHVSAVEPYDTDKEGKALLYLAGGLAGGKVMRIDLPVEQVALLLMGQVEVK